jgi:hypothetical protein
LGLEFSRMALGSVQALQLPHQGSFFYAPVAVLRGGLCSAAGSLASLGLLLPGTISLEGQRRTVSLHCFSRLLSWLSELAGAGRTSGLKPSRPQQQGGGVRSGASSSGGSAEEVAVQLSVLRLQHRSSRREEEGRELLHGEVPGGTRLSRTAVQTPTPALLTCRLASGPGQTPPIVTVELCSNVLLSRVASSSGAQPAANWRLVCFAPVWLCCVGICCSSASFDCRSAPHASCPTCLQAPGSHARRAPRWSSSCSLGP